MNDLQNSYAKTDNSLGHLLVQVDTFYQDLPEPVRRAFDALGSTAKWGCHSMRNWQMDGWTEKDWDEITEADDDLRAVARELDNAALTGAESVRVEGTVMPHRR